MKTQSVDICSYCGHDAHCKSVDGVYWPNHECKEYVGTGGAGWEYYCECEKCRCPKCKNHIVGDR